MNITLHKLNWNLLKRFMLIAAPPFLGLAAATVLLSAPAAAQSGPEFHACYVPGSGTVYRIKEPGLRQECSSPNHVAFSWKPEGEPGTDGVLGYTIVTSDSGAITPEFLFGGRSADCPSGKRVLGGGASITTPNLGFSGAWDIEVLQSYPGIDGTSWRSAVGIRNPQGVAFVWRVYAICANVE
jgi:hypothetical protein